MFPSAFAQGEPSDILWDKIISIEPLGPMQVYDIEVEATHNFIAEGIVAHNTYTDTKKSVTSNQKPEEIASSALGKKDNNQGLSFIKKQIHMQILKFKLVLNTARTITDEYDKSQALASIAKALAKAGRLNEAGKIFDEALNTARTITYENKKLQALAFIAQALAEAGRLDEALNTARTITNEHDKSQALVSIAKALAEADKPDEATAKEAESEINIVLDELKILTGLNQDNLAEPLFILFHNGFLLDEIKEEKFWLGLVRFMRQSGANIINNSVALKEIDKDNAEKLFSLLSDYFMGFEVSLYLPKLFAQFRQSQGQKKKTLLANFKNYYSSFVNGRKPEEGLLGRELIEEIHYSVIGSTNLTPETYHLTLERFKSQDIPPPNFTTPFTLYARTGKLILSEITKEEEEFIRKILTFLKQISQRALPEVITAILTFFHHVYLKPDSSGLADNIKGFVQGLKQDASVKEELSSPKVNWEDLKKAILTYLQNQKNLDYSAILKEMTGQLIYHSRGKPTERQIKTSLDKMISLSLILQPHLKDTLDSISLENPLTPETLFAISEVLSEIKPEADPELKALIDEVSGKKELAEIINKRVRAEEGEGFLKLEFIPAKTSLDLFFGNFGEDCASRNPEELFNPNFTPLRILREGKIVGAIYTLTLEIEGKKSLVIVGIEPQTPLANQLNAERFVEDLLNKLTEVASHNGYEQLLISTGEGVLSNRENIRKAMKNLTQNKPTIQQSVQTTFPAQTSYSIENLAVWKEISASSPAVKKDDPDLGLCLTSDSLITLANGSQKPLIELKPSSHSHRVGVSGEEEGDMVLSLNEGTGKLEPHRVLALLDMGVKPVYRITTESGKSLKTTLTHPYLTKDGWKKLQDIKVGEEVAAVSESFGNTAGANERDFIPSNNYQRIFEKVKDVFFYKWPQDLKKANRHKGIDSKEDYSFVSSQRESIETTEVSIQRKYNPIFFCAERGNLFIAGSFQPYISGFNDIVAGFLQEFNCAAEKAMVSKQPHLTYLVDNNLFVFEDSCSIVKAGFNVFKSDIRIALLDNLFGSKSLLNKFQDHIQRDSRSFDTRLAKADFGVNRDSFCQSIVSHYFHLLIILYHKIKEASSHILRPNAYAQRVSESDILWDKIISIEPLGPMSVYDIEVEATHNFIAQGIVAHNTYTNKQKTENREQRTEGSKMVDSPLQEKRKAGSLAIKNLKLLKEVLSSYQIIFNLHDTAQEFAPDLILNIWLEIDRHLQAGKIKIDLDAGSLKEFILLFKDEEMVEAVGKILANRVLNLLDRDLTKIKKEIKSKNYGNIPGIIKKLFDNPFVSIVEEAQHDFPKLFENFHNSKNTFMEMLRNRLAPLSSLADQLAKKLSVSEDMDENGKTMGELLNNYLQATKDLLRQLKFRLEEITVRRDEQLTPEEKQGLKFVEGELPYALLLRGKESRIIGRLNWSYAPDRNQIDNVSIRILQPEEQGEGYGMELWRGAGLSGLLDGKRDGKVVVDGIAETLQAQGFWRKVLKYENESLPEEKCEIKIMIKDGESKREINLSQLQAGDIMIEFTITIPVSSSSLVKESANDLGGVDFIRLPIISQPEITPRSTMAGSPALNISRFNLDEEWRQMQRMLEAGIIPSSERLREYALASSSLKSEDYSREIDKLLGCIADILRLEEERVLPIEPTLREILVLLESDKPANELQSHLSKITVLPKEPKPFENF